MKWRGRGGAGRIEDRRGAGGGLGGGGMSFPVGKAGGGGVGLIILIVIYLLTGGVPGGGGGGLGVDPGTGQFQPAPSAGSSDLDKAPADEPAKFVDFVAGDVDATWKKIFAESGKPYEPETIVLYDDAVSTACGNTSSNVGPFYCPGDRKVYLDLPFLDQLQKELGAPGEFARAYVIAHEIGHHVQNLLGVMDDVDLSRQENPEDANELSVRLELQADCLAGIWGHSAYTRGDLLDSGDLEKGLAAAAAVGDDRIQQQSGQGVHPESFTHGTSEQRAKWFRTGFDSGDPTACDTFKGDL